jgi:hypothetical protein
MKVVPMLPNYLKNKGKDFSKHGQNGAEKRPVTKKKHIEIPNSIKEADEVEEVIAKVLKRVKVKGKSKKGIDKRTTRGHKRKKDMSSKV